ncbi:MAG: GTP cyclohydrolase I FolE [Streptococcus hyointestinalis]|uniref:GTP cyclohydrolase I FolE n=1 Tax=Streptococcus hyointestinalis TaxID=1337 RepID=UPI0013DED2F3|nr:GTP cyclohydrolase I FolE [Streptococcus hyointestinalis]MCI6872274.1 GTP cyclohydrolase I FolE [Streptococcus hyointestinalis]MDD6383916.1 GTP cyclohydrolase I FolE [Streptococcus hyointestinalis]MDD7355606.1 GTP cyclohydrolase I FolE [Streptococcus hyointestinalis]MDY4553380.1 GTP cyclohydrolase I FolE [Streptococcus hyointestinalis]
MDLEKAEQAVYQLLEALGENPEREGLKETPARVVRMYQEMWQGLHKDPKDEFTAVFNEGNGEAVIVRDIPFYSMCEHHLVPFYGKAHIAYLPNTDGQVTGLSKLARCVETASKRPQVQERLTAEIADGIEQALKPQGVYVFVEAEHMCMTMRGIKKPGSKTITTASRGCYQKDALLRQELLTLLKLG